MNLPLVPFPDKNDYRSWDELASIWEKRYPDQDATDFAMAILYNGSPFEEKPELTALECTQHGYKDEKDWHWTASFSDGSTWHCEGGCDYTGWDCQSGLGWEKVNG